MSFLFLAQLSADTQPLDPVVLLELVNHLITALKAGNTALAVVLVSVGVTHVVRAFGVHFFPQLGTDRASYILAVVTGILTALSADLIAGAPLNLNTVTNIIVSALASIGAHQAKKLKKQAAAVGVAAGGAVDSPQAALDAMNAGPKP